MMVDPSSSFPLSEELTPAGVDITRQLLHLVDRDLDGIALDGHAIGWDIVCKPGCAACCTFLVGVVIQESALVAARIAILPAAVRAGILGRLVAWERAWRLRYGPLPLPTAVLPALEWQAQRIACPMLDPQTYTCLVYEQRPIACRTHHACRWPDDAGREPGCCEITEPGDGCFTVQANIDHGGHQANVWQLDLSLLTKWTAELHTQLMTRPGTGYPEAGLLPLQVLRIGRERYGWKNPGKVVKLQVLAHTSPRPR